MLLETLAFGGTCVLVGMGRLEFKVNVMDFITQSKKVIASNCGTKEDIAAIYKLMAAGKLKPMLHEIKPSYIPKGIEELGQGKVKGRLVAVYEE